MTFDILNRRTHLYLGIVLAPWFLMYGASTVVFNHGDFFHRLHNNPEPGWALQYERDYSLPPIQKGAHAWNMGGKVLNDLGLPRPYRAWVDGDGVLQMFRIKFLGNTRARYYPDRHRLRVEKMEFRWDRFLTGMHVRGGWEWPGFWDKFWSFTVDMVVLATLIWIFSGLYIWWTLKRFRFWGGLSLAAGGLSFLVFIIGL